MDFMPQESRMASLKEFNKDVAHLLKIGGLPESPRDVISQPFCFHCDYSSEVFYGMITGIYFSLGMLERGSLVVRTNLKENGNPCFFLFVAEDQTWYK